MGVAVPTSAGRSPHSRRSRHAARSHRARTGATCTRRRADGSSGVCGIDVSKARLDLALGATGELLNAANDANVIAALRERLLSMTVARGSWKPAADSRLPWSPNLAQPGCRSSWSTHARSVISRATGRLAKTDALDARAGAVWRAAPP